MTQAVPVATAEKKSYDRLQLVKAPRSLLVIEDDLSLIQFIDAILEDQYRDLEWVYVNSGEAALELIERRGKRDGRAPYSLVMTDIFLEGESTGFDVWLDCQKLYPDMPFAITSYISFDRYFSILRGVRNCPVYLPKPLTVGRCQALFEEYFTK
jgi:DNA-binding NtrC family response regulator